VDEVEAEAEEQEGLDEEVVPPALVSGDVGEGTGMVMPSMSCLLKVAHRIHPPKWVAVGHAVALAYADRYTAVEMQLQAIRR
jgi:hypothetical protein